MTYITQTFYPVFCGLKKYIDSLKQEFFNGYVVLDSGNQKSYLMLIDGEPHAYLTTIQDKSELKSISPRAFNKTAQQDCFVFSYRCAPQYITFFSKYHTAKPIYKNLTSKSISPANLIEKCRKGNFSGIIEGVGKSSKKKAIYFENGKILGVMNISTNDDIFHSKISEPVIYNELNGLLLNLFEFAKETNTIDTASGNRDSLITCYEEIFQFLETNAQVQDFASIWRINAQKLSQQYAFLDPFVAEFKYNDGKIDLWEEIDLKLAGKGIDALCESIAKTMRMPKDQIKEIKNKYKKVLSAYEIRT